MTARFDIKQACMIASIAAATSLLLIYAHRSSVDGSLPLQILDDKGQPAAYSMVVKSPITIKGKTHSISVRMYWDALGRYSHYEMPMGARLLKNGDTLFTQADHKKLQGILKDRSSPLRTNPILPPSSKEKVKVDAVTAATPATLSRAVVKGAAYTCYNLWHLAHGEMVETLRDITADTLTPEMLNTWLLDSDDEKVIFALSSVKRRGMYDQKTIGLVERAIKTAHARIIDGSLAYFRQAIPGDNPYYRKLAQLFPDIPARGRVYILTLLGEDKGAVPADFHDMLSGALPKMERYYEVHLLLTLIEKRGQSSSVIIERVADLLESEDFFIARRSFWFLEKQELSTPLKQKVETFRQKNNDRL